MRNKALGDDLSQDLSRLRPCQLPAARKAERDRRGEVAGSAKRPLRHPPRNADDHIAVAFAWADEERTLARLHGLCTGVNLFRSDKPSKRV
jgi:hypothetical protein